MNKLEEWLSQPIDKVDKKIWEQLNGKQPKHDLEWASEYAEFIRKQLNAQEVVKGEIKTWNKEQLKKQFSKFNQEITIEK